MMLLPEAPELGYIPMGTTNDSATTLGLSQDPLQAAYTAAFGRSIQMDVGRFNGIYFSYVAAFGAFTEVSYETPQDQKNYLGRVAYYLDAMRRLSHLTHRRCRVEFDGGVLEDDFIFCAVSNSRSIAGIFRLSASDGALLSDGLFEIILIKTPESILQLGPIITDVLANKFTSGYVTLLHSKKARFVFDDPVAWTLDGEDGGEHTEVVCENVPHAIRMMVNGER
jgi:YegS/Rv2252/BmrU family lipid kinase